MPANVPSRRSHELSALLAALVAFAAVLPLWALRRPGLGVRLATVLATSGALTVGVLQFAIPAPTPFASAAAPLAAPGPGYTGSAACRSCHPAEHASWRASFHRTMTQVASRDVIVDAFERRELDWFGKPVVLEWRGEALWVDFDRGGSTPAHVHRPVEQTTGSHHFQVLWYSTGRQRELAPVPMAFKLAERQWIPLTSVFVLPPEYRDPPDPGTWNQNCQMCHATNVRPRVDIGRCDTEVTELGIACEACHGPGARHVAANRNPLRRYELHLAGGAGDPTIVDPERLSTPRAAMVCGQCHAVNILHQEHHDAWRETGLVYRPGDDLRTTNLVIDPSARDAPELTRTLQHNPNFFRGSFWSDGEVRLSGREYNGLVKSPCYVHGSGERQLDCTSCHSLHDGFAAGADAWRDDQLAPGRRGNLACTQCHERYGDAAALAAHTHHAPDSPGSECYACHMPYTTFGLMKAMRSHTIGSPRVATELATGRPNACNLCHLDRTLRWTNESLQANYGIEPAPLDADRADVAAGARWLLAGDAGQRVLAAYAMGLPEVQRTAGSDWLAPYLAQLLDDPYYVVRFGAARSLRGLGFDDALTGYDFLAESPRARGFGDAVRDRWRAAYRGGDRQAVLLHADGALDAAFARLYAKRDDRPVYLAE